MRTAKELGFRAFSRGVPRSKNTFLRGTPEYVQWVVGWRKAQSDYFKQLKGHIL